MYPLSKTSDLKEETKFGRGLTGPIVNPSILYLYISIVGFQHSESTPEASRLFISTRGEFSTPKRIQAGTETEPSIPPGQLGAVLPLNSVQGWAGGGRKGGNVPFGLLTLILQVAQVQDGGQEL